MTDNNTQTATQQDQAVFGLGETETKNLPMVIETQGDVDLINRTDMDEIELQLVAQRVAEHDINNSAANLYYGAASQKRLSTILDQLLGNVKAKDAGLAGVLATELNDGIDMLHIEQTKKQIVEGKQWYKTLFAFLIRLFGGIVDYIDYLIEIQDKMVTKFNELEAKYNNRIQTLTNRSNALDGLVNATVEQIASLRIDIAAGEDILAAAKAKYKIMAEAALKSNETLELQRVRDFNLQIGAFDTRFVQLKHSFVEASAVTIPRVRRSQEAIKIEIEGIVRGILFVIPKIKSTVIELLALYDTKKAQNDRIALNDAERKLDLQATELLSEISKVAKQSQGMALERANSLKELAQAVIDGIKADRENEKQAAENRREAEKVLVKLKQEVDASIKQANIDAANEKL